MTFLDSSSLVKIKDSLGAYTFTFLCKWTFKNNEKQLLFDKTFLFQLQQLSVSTDLLDKTNKSTPSKARFSKLMDRKSLSLLFKVFFS